MAYLDADVARNRLIAAGLYTAETAPTEAWLAEIIADIQALIDDWLGQPLGIAEYKQNTVSNRHGSVRLHRTPVAAVKSVLYYIPHQPNRDPLPATPVNGATPFWQPGDNFIYTSMPYTSLEIVYEAGLDPLPRQAGMSVWQLLLAMDEAGGLLSGDSGILIQPASSISSLSVPGGISKSWTRAAMPGAKEDKAFTKLDEVLGSTLRDFRNKFRFI